MSKLQMEVQDFKIEGQVRQHVRPACTREVDGREVVSAGPGRRYVKTATAFGQNGYVYSICNEDWRPAVWNIAEVIARLETATCFPMELGWEPTPTGDCPACGVSTCDMVVEYARTGADLDDESCPDGMGIECEKGCRFGAEITNAGQRTASGRFVKVTCLLQGELTADECHASDSASLGAQCTEPGFSNDELDNYPDGPVRISSKQGCDCLTYAKRNYDAEYDDYGNRWEVNHFCTRPCTKGCSSGFTCVEMFSDLFDIPNDMADSYCVPT